MSKRSEAWEKVQGTVMGSMHGTPAPLTAKQLAAVVGEPGFSDYHGPNWAKIAAKKDRIAKLELRIGELCSQRVDLEGELADLISEARAVIASSREGA